jgi:hypothetical protein
MAATMPEGKGSEMTYEEIEAAVLALDNDQKHRLRYALHISLESYPLASFCAADVEELALEEFAPSEALKQACSDAAAHVWNKWGGDGEMAGAAEDWAVSIVRERAAELALQPAAIEASA